MFATRCHVSTNALIPTDHSCVNAMLDMCSVLTRGHVMVCLYTFHFFIVYYVLFLLLKTLMNVQLMLSYVQMVLAV